MWVIKLTEMVFLSAVIRNEVHCAAILQAMTGYSINSIPGFQVHLATE